MSFDPIDMPCMTNGDELLMLGDSYVSYVASLQPPLEAAAQAAGQLPEGEYRNRARAGADIAEIRRQWNAGKADMPKYIVMDGGGNNVLLNAPHCLSDGSTSDPSCTTVIDNVIEEALLMVGDMKASGVSGVVYFFYPHIPLGGTEILDYALPMLYDLCGSLRDGSFSCVIVDTIPEFEGRPELISDSVHPTDEGQEMIADLIWTAMEKHCLGHFSGCCI